MTLTHNQILHREYLKSPVWKAKRLQALIHYGAICNRCGSHGTDVHHKTYARWGGDELIEDLEILCRQCHEAHHRVERAGRRSKRRRRKPKLHAKALFSYLSETQKKALLRQFGYETAGAFYATFISEESGKSLRKAAAKMLGVAGFDGIHKKDAHKGKLRKKKNAIISPEQRKELEHEAKILREKQEALKKKRIILEG